MSGNPLNAGENRSGCCQVADGSSSTSANNNWVNRLGSWVGRCSSASFLACDGGGSSRLCVLITRVSVAVVSRGIADASGIAIPARVTLVPAARVAIADEVVAAFVAKALLSDALALVAHDFHVTRGPIAFRISTVVAVAEDQPVPVWRGPSLGAARVVLVANHPDIGTF